MTYLRPIVMLLGSLVLAACAPAAAPAPSGPPAAAPSAAPSPAASALADAGDLVCVTVEGEEPVCGRQAATAPMILVPTGRLAAASSPRSVNREITYAFSRPIIVDHGTRSAAGGIREVCISATPPAGIELALLPIGDRELPLGTEPLCLTGPGGGSAEGLRFTGDVVMDDEGRCASCWAFVFTAERMLLRHLDAALGVRTEEIALGESREITLPGDVRLTFTFIVGADRRIQIVIT